MCLRTPNSLSVWAAWFTAMVAMWPTAWVRAQCSMCRAVLETEASGKAAEGINNGIVYLMVFPYILVGLAMYAVYRTWRKKSAPPVS